MSDPQHTTQQQQQQEKVGSKTSLRLQQQQQQPSSPCSSNPASPTYELPVGPRSRRTLKNEDSSYDSDFESSEVLGPTSSELGPTSTETTPLGGEEEHHEDVSRTVSDTLGAEFAEYVTIQPNTSTTPVLPTATSKTSVTTEEVTTTISCASSVAACSVPSSLVTSSALPSSQDAPSKNKDEPTPLLSDSKTAPLSTAKSPLTSTSSLPSHSTLASKNATSGSVVIRSNVSVSGVSTRPSSAPVTQSLARSLSTSAGTTVTQAGPAAAANGTGQSWVGSDSSIYQQQVEFGIKLGYSESLVQLALEKLGGKPAKNELLDELIRLGAGVPKSESDLEAAQAATGEAEDKENDPSLSLRPVIIDGSNVAMSHGNKNVFSCRGVSVCVEWFRERGHKDILVFVPTWRKEPSRWDAKITDQHILTQLEQEKVLVFTPSRTGHTSGRRIIPYDDRYILNEAVRSGGVVVSNDNFRDLSSESAAFRRVVEEALLMYSWVNGRFVPPDDPLGRNGPSLDAFLRRPMPNTPQARDLRPCPYGKKCTYGNKCKYQHPERGAQPVKSVTERLQEHREKHYMDKAAKSRDSSPGESLRANYSLPVGVVPVTSASGNGKKPLSRTHSSHASTTSAAPLTLPPALLHDSPTKDTTTRVSQPDVSAAHFTLDNTVSAPPVHTSPTHAPPIPVSMQQRMMLSAQPSFDQNKLQQLPRDTFKNQMFKSESCLYPLMTSQPHQMPQQQQTPHMHHATAGQQQPQMHMPQQQVHLQQPQGYQQRPTPPAAWSYHQDNQDPTHYPEAHLMAERQPSDPERAAAENNPHQKLRRQLTLNPSNDHRLAKMTKGASLQKSLPMGGQFGGIHNAPPGQYQQHIAQQMQGMSLSGNQPMLSQQYSSPMQPFSPFGSDAKAPQLQQTAQGQVGGSGGSQQQQPSSHHPPLPSHVYQQQASHPHVARYSSAPDPIGGGTGSSGGASGSQYTSAQGPPTITRLNSTSDPHLNLYGNTDSPHYMSEPYDETQLCRAPFFAPHHNLSAAQSSASPGPVGSRPMSPHQQSLLQQTRNPPVHQTNLSSLLNTSFPPPKSGGKQEERTRLYYHLINLFPEDKVLAALAKHPNETDVVKICSSIIGFSSADASGSSAAAASPLSSAQPQPSHLPQQPLPQSSSQHLPPHQHLSSCQSMPLPLRVPSPNNPPSSFPAMPHEHSRLREYMNPQGSLMESDDALRSLVSPMTSIPAVAPLATLQQQQTTIAPGQQTILFPPPTHDAT